MATPTQEIWDEQHALEQDAEIHLFEISTRDAASHQVLRYCQGPLNGASIRFGNDTYAPLPGLTLTNIEYGERGSEPELEFSTFGTDANNESVNITEYLLLAFNVFNPVGLKVKRIVTYKKFLYGQPQANGAQKMAEETWIVRMLGESNKETTRLLLRSPLALDGAKAPAVLLWRDSCWREYPRMDVDGNIISTTHNCPHVNESNFKTEMFKEDGTSTTKYHENACGRNLRECERRHASLNKPVPYGGCISLGRRY